jgi:DNA-binding response OmpR family regulator
LAGVRFSDTLGFMPASASKPLSVMPAVLLLEDNTAYRNLLTEVLTLAGFEVCAAPDGRKVTEILQSRHIELVITDLVMPERDGIEIMTELRYTHPRLPVIAISGDVPLNTHLYLTLAQKLGAARVIAKPFRMEELIAAAREAIAASNPPQAESPPSA